MPARVLACLLAAAVLAPAAAGCGADDEPETAEAQPEVAAPGLQQVLTDARDRVYEALGPAEADEEHLTRSRDEIRAAAGEVEEAEVPEELAAYREMLVVALRQIVDRLDGAASSAAADPTGTIEKPALDRLVRRELVAMEEALDAFRDEGYDVAAT